MQNPITPTRSPVTESRLRRWSTAPLMSWPAVVMFMAIINLPASSGSVVVSPWYRSGASTVNPSAASRSATSRMWGTRPQYSWIRITPGPDPPAAVAR